MQTGHANLGKSQEAGIDDDQLFKSNTEKESLPLQETLQGLPASVSLGL